MTTNTKLDIKQLADDICDTVKKYDIQNIIVINNRKLFIQYLKLGIASIICQSIDGMMLQKYPGVAYSNSIKHGDYSVEFTLL